MPKVRIRLLIFLFLFPVILSGQITDYGFGYQSAMIGNPSVTGTEGDGILRLSYLNLYPGNSFNLHSVVLSYDGYFPSLHGGAGFWLSDDYLGGIFNDLKAGVSYSYHLKAGDDLYFTGGLSASVYNRGFDYSNAVLPGQIDPFGGVVYPQSEVINSRGNTVFDLGTGFMVISGWFFGGFSITHLSEPDLSKSDYSEDKLSRTLMLHAAGDFYLSKAKNLKIRPVAKCEMNNKWYSIAGGVGIENNTLSFSSLIITDISNNIDIQSGFSINTRGIIVFYNYSFNIVSGNNLMPFSLMHHTGLAFSLNNVDKIKTVKTINFPKL
jgi:type IX secretion system PorP/SprF family membrane protein